MMMMMMTSAGSVSGSRCGSEGPRGLVQNLSVAASTAHTIGNAAIASHWGDEHGAKPQAVAGVDRAFERGESTKPDEEQRFAVLPLIGDHPRWAESRHGHRVGEVVGELLRILNAAECPQLKCEAGDFKFAIHPGEHFGVTRRRSRDEELGTGLTRLSQLLVGDAGVVRCPGTILSSQMLLCLAKAINRDLRPTCLKRQQAKRR